MPAVLPLGRRLLTSGPTAHDLAAHRAAFPDVARLSAHPRAMRPGVVLDALQESGLRGRGGGHVLAAAKWRSVLASGGPAVLVANGAEGEPASAKDAALLLLRPHLVLDGLELAASVLAAPTAVLWLHEGDRDVYGAVARALAERRRAHDRATARVDIQVRTGPAAYISGESSAVVRGLSGFDALPELVRRHASEHGVYGRPTLVQNVETLARASLVVAAALRGDTPRVAQVAAGGLATVVLHGNRVVLDVPPGTRLGDLLAPGLSGAPPQAVLTGGYGGTWLRWDEAREATVSEHGLRAVGGALGAGILAPLPASGCGLRETARVLDYLAGSGAGQCGPCVFGLPALAGVLDRLADGDARRRDLRRLSLWAAEVDGRGACHHPDGAVRLLRSALRVFQADVRRHLTGRPCAGADALPLLPVPASAGAP
jgi:NADH:ubiquinone oxidoreductase subunit F (NADH-binding)